MSRINRWHYKNELALRTAPAYNQASKPGPEKAVPEIKAAEIAQLAMMGRFG